jgi:hypothetical protein
VFMRASVTIMNEKASAHEVMCSGMLLEPIRWFS